MEEQALSGNRYFVKRGRVESSGNATVFRNFSRLQSVTFADGEVVRDILVDGTLAAYITSDTQGAFAFRQGRGKSWYFVAVEMANGQVRGADRISWKNIAIESARGALLPVGIGVAGFFWAMAAGSVGLFIIPAVAAFFAGAAIAEALRRNNVAHLAALMVRYRVVDVSEQTQDTPAPDVVTGKA